MHKDYDKLIQYGLRISSKKRYTIVEMEKKLKMYVNKRKSMSDEHIETVIERLIELKYLDDEQFIKDYVAGRIRLKPRGKFLIVRELRLKGLSKDLIGSVMDNIEIDEARIAVEALERRISRLKKYPPEKQKMKAYQFLYSRGFERSAIYRAIEECYNLRVL